MTGPGSGVWAALPVLFLAVWLTAPPARANPHVWVESSITFRLGEGRVRGLTFVWRFDDYYSTHAIGFYDTDRDGVLGTEEIQALRAGTFDPLVRSDYYVHVWAGGRKQAGHSIDRFTARVEQGRLVLEFSVPVTPAADPRQDPVIVSLFDHKNVVDLRFARKGFLLVAGALSPDCRFRIARGKGEQAGHPQPVTLRCGA